MYLHQHNILVKSTKENMTMDKRYVMTRIKKTKQTQRCSKRKYYEIRNLYRGKK